MTHEFKTDSGVIVSDSLNQFWLIRVIWLWIRLHWLRCMFTAQFDNAIENICIIFQCPNFLLTQLNSEYKLTTRIKHHRFSHGTVDSVMCVHRTVNRIKHDENDWIPTVADQVLDSSAHVIQEVRQRKMCFIVLNQIRVIEWVLWGVCVLLKTLVWESVCVHKKFAFILLYWSIGE